MPRYIDAEVLKQLRDDVISGKLDIKTEGDLIDICPTADVAPRAEVAQEIFEDIDDFLKNQEVVADGDRRCKEFGDWILHDYLPRHFSELKNKYTEEKSNEIT